MKKVFIFLISATLLLPTMVALAADDLSYTVLAPLPGVGDDNGKTTLEKYVPAVFKLAIGLSAVAAVLMIVIGGFQYISSDALMKKNEGRERIKNAVFGLVLVISAWLILNTINPNLLNINLNIESISTATVDGGKITLGGELSAGTGSITQGYTLTQAQIDQNAAMVADLKKYGIEVNNNGKPCADGGISGCTNLVGMVSNTYQGIKDLKTACGGDNCGTITITGGTEGGHKSHGPNKPPVDLSVSNNTLNQYITDTKNQVVPVQQSSLGPIYTVKVGSRNATFLLESNPPHWHVVFE